MPLQSINVDLRRNATKKQLAIHSKSLALPNRAVPSRARPYRAKSQKKTLPRPT
jgi:hypothetical protein